MVSEFINELFCMLNRNPDKSNLYPIEAPFFYVVKDLKGNSKKGHIYARSLREAIRKLEKKSFLIITIEKTTKVVAISLKKWTQNESFLFFRQMSIMLRSGLPMLRALHTLTLQSTDPDVKTILTAMRKKLESGYSLSNALQQFPQFFSQFQISIVKAAEEGGFLDMGLEYLAQVVEKEQSLLRKVRGALIYPVAVLSIGIACLLGISYFIMPYVNQLVKDMGIELPLITRIVMNTIGSTGKWFIFVPLLLALIYAVLRLILFVKSNEMGKSLWDRCILKIPLISVVVKKTAIARMLLIFSALAKAGIPVLNALRIVAEATENCVICEAIRAMKKSVEEGGSISQSMEARNEIFSRTISSMIAVGEQTGDLTDISERTADLMEAELSTALDNFTTLIEPFAICLLGLLVGAVLVSFFIPIYSALNRIT